MSHSTFALHDFDSLQDATEGFNPDGYSWMKFGSRYYAKQFGQDLAEGIFDKYAELLLSEQCVVIPSPYNYVKNAATIMTEYMYDHLNFLLVNTAGNAVDFSTIHRKVSYTADYGFLPKDKRQALLNNDLFYVNEDFVKNKSIIFVDDVKITGTHEDKLKELIRKYNLNNKKHIFAYYAQYYGDSPKIEADLNFYAFPDKANIMKDFVASLNGGDSELIVRPVKYLMKAELTNFDEFVSIASAEVITQLYYSCLAEGYYKIPEFQENFTQLQKYMLTHDFI